MSLSPDGEIVNFLQLNSENKSLDEFVKRCQLGSVEDMVSVNVSFVGACHVLVEENYGGCYQEHKRQQFHMSAGNGEGSEGCSGECLETEMYYTQLANRTSPGGGGDRAWRRHKRREKERLAKRRWEPEHFVKIVNCSPTKTQPLQGLWKVLLICLSFSFSLFIIFFFFLLFW